MSGRMLEMSEINRQKVLNYINDRDYSPLVFIRGDWVYGGSFNSKKIELDDDSILLDEIERLKNIESLDELMLTVLKDTEIFWSKNTVTKEVETDSGRHRSVFDIWRHILYFKPTTTIFEVMKSISDNRNELGYQYCPTVNRRVFNIYPGIDGRFNSTHPDEFDLHFSDWETICDE
jgi:hypothetical protein